MANRVDQPGLEVTLGSQPKTFLLETGAACYIGRGEQNGIVLDDVQVSRQHAMVQCAANGECWVVDLGSRNGTTVNQRRVTGPVVLEPGDRINIGQHEFVFRGPARRARDANDAAETAISIDQQTITVLVADIRDFTGLSARLGEAKVSEIVSAFMRESGAALSDCGAWGQKYIGDAVMAIWLHAGDVPDLREMAAALRGLQETFRIAATLQERFGLEAPIEIGAGINTGLACVGNMGSDASSDYTALSDAVNLAFRLEAATRQIGCDLAVGHRTFECLAAHAALEGVFTMHSVPLKGYRAAKRVYAANREALGAILAALPNGEEASAKQGGA